MGGGPSAVAVTQKINSTASINHFIVMAENIVQSNRDLERQSNRDLERLCENREITSLDLSGCVWLTDLSPLSGLSQLTSLDLSDCESLTFLSELSGLIRLTSLNLYGCSSLVDLSGLSGLSQLTSLNLSGCKSLTDLSPLSGLSQLTSLNLSYCESLVDLSGLSGLSQLTSLDLSECESLTSLSELSGLSRLTSLQLSKKRLDRPNLALLKRSERSLADLSALSGLCQLTSLVIWNFESLTDLSWLSGLSQLTSLDISGCESLTSLPPMSGLIRLTSLDLGGCKSLTSLSSLSGLIRLTSLNLYGCSSLIDLSGLSGLSQLTSLDLSGCKSLTDLSGLSGMSQLTSLNLSYCESLIDLSELSGLSQLTSLNLSGCKSLTDLSPLSGLSRLPSLDLSECDRIFDLAPCEGFIALESLEFTSRRVQSIEPLRKLPLLRELEEFNPPEVAEVLAHAACLRIDRDFIHQHKDAWLGEAKGWKNGPQWMQDRFAATLGEAFGRLGEDPIASLYEDYLESRPDFTAGPWKAWFATTLQESGFELYCKRLGRVPVSDMLPAAIGGGCVTLPYEQEADWSRQWLLGLEAARLAGAKKLLGVAPEICLAYARLGLADSLRRWLESFTDPSDSGALDAVHAALAGFQLSANQLQAAESHLFAIQSPSLRDPGLAELVTAWSGSDAEHASAHLLLIETPAIRTRLAKSLVTLPEFSGSEVALHRLVVAMGESPEALGELIALLPTSAGSSRLIQEISESLQRDRQGVLRKIAEALHHHADRLLTLK
jgi:Leucine-rich repeat (LRR) protein